MTRVWLILTAVGAVNVLSAVTVAFFSPSLQAPAAIERPPLQPVLNIAPADYRFEQRVRAVLRREMEGRDVIGPSLNPTAAALARSGGAASRFPNDGGSLDRSQPMTPAMLTPFGLYPAGFRGVGLVFLSLCTLLAAGSLVTYLTPVRVHWVQRALEFSWRNVALLGAVGLLGYGLSLLLMFVLITLVVGIPFAALLLLIVAAATVIGFMGVSLALGRWLRIRLDLPFSSPLFELTLGIAFIFPLGILPVIGWPVVLATLALGFGGLLVTKGGTGEPWSIAALKE